MEYNLMSESENSIQVSEDLDQLIIRSNNIEGSYITTEVDGVIRVVHEYKKDEVIVERYIGGGETLSLNKTRIYKSFTSKDPFTKYTGTYFLYNGVMKNDRYAIVDNRSKANTEAKNIVGYVRKYDISI